jgi:hypothetical protein
MTALRQGYAFSRHGMSELFKQITLGKSKRAQGMPGDGLTHGPPAAKKAGGSHHR